VTWSILFEQDALDRELAGEMPEKFKPPCSKSRKPRSRPAALQLLDFEHISSWMDKSIKSASL
jgi:hypothetical protein